MIVNFCSKILIFSIFRSRNSLCDKHFQHFALKSPHFYFWTPSGMIILTHVLPPLKCAILEVKISLFFNSFEETLFCGFNRLNYSIRTVMQKRSTLAEINKHFSRNPAKMLYPVPPGISITSSACICP